jgi:hypothetical protein
VRCSTALKRFLSLASTRERGSRAGHSTVLSKERTANRSAVVRPSIIRAAARRAAVIFQPVMLPERSRTRTTSRGRTCRAAAKPPSTSGGHRVSAAGTRGWDWPPRRMGVGKSVRTNVPSPAVSASAVIVADARTSSWSVSANPRRRMKSRSSRSPGCSVMIVWPSPRLRSAMACRLDRIISIGNPAGSTSMVRASRTGFGKPGSRTGGVMREASGTAAVSGEVPVPTGGPSSRPSPCPSSRRSSDGPAGM